MILATLKVAKCSIGSHWEESVADWLNVVLEIGQRLSIKVEEDDCQSNEDNQ